MPHPGPLITAQETSSAPIEAYVSRLLADWLVTRPEERWRALDGSLAFADISGFTRLTERLARKGKVGAEEMNDLLNTCFTELLRVAWADGADLVKWGGDAVLLLFEGPEHAARACHAALAMQHTLARTGGLRTSLGPVRLRMSVGIHSGRLHFFRAGRLHWDVIPAGPGATATAVVEAIATAGEVMASTAAVPSLAGCIWGDQRDGAVRVYRAQRGRWAAPIEAPVPAGVDLTQCLPLRVREHVLSKRREPEHRSIAVAFLEFGGTDDLLARDGPDALARALDESIVIAQEEAHRYEVTFLETDIARNGVKVLLAAGSPASAGDDEERMLRTVRAIMDAGPPLPMRSGITNGRVFSADFGPPWRRTFSIKGDIVNLAARIAAKAEYGQILTIEDTMQHSRTLFQTERLPPFMVKGKARPVQALVLGRQLSTRAGAAGASLPLVGRTHELETMLRLLDAARTGEGRVVDLIGEPGTGKSRLVDEVAARAPDVDVLRTACAAYEAATPYFALKPLLRQVVGLDEVADPVVAGSRLAEMAGRIAPSVLPWLPLVAVPVGVTVPPTPESDRLEDRFRRTYLAEAVRELLGALLTRPTMLVFEDIHWMDDASRDLLGQLAPSAAQHPWLMVTTRQPGDMVAWPAHVQALVTTIQLEPLAPEEAAALAERATDEAPLPPHIVAALAARSGGNPLFLTELVAAARAAVGVEALPDTIESLLTAQIDHLGPDDRMVLRAAAVLGSPFDVSLLEAALEGRDAPLDDAVWQRLANFVLREGGTARFRHALIRDVAYEGLPYRRRRELHARVGETLAQLAGDSPEARAAALSLHFFHAQRFEEAWRYSRQAGDSAWALYANVEAEAFYRRAIEAARSLKTMPPSELTDVFERLGEALVRLGEFEQAGRAFTQSRRVCSCEEPAKATGLMLKQALVPWRLGRYPQALHWIQRGLHALRFETGAEAAAQRARLQVWRAVILHKQGRPLLAARWCRRAIAEAERAGPPADDALAHAYDILDGALVALGRFGELGHGEQALKIYERQGNRERQAQIQNNLGFVAHFQSRWNEALERYESARRLWTMTGDRWAASFATGNIGLIRLDQGRLDEAEPLFRDALRVARASHTSGATSVLINLGRLAARRGQFEEARQTLAAARAEFERAGQRTSILQADARLAECLALQGDAPAALTLADDVLARATGLGGVYTLRAVVHRVRGIALLQSGRLAEAHTALTEALAEARAKRADYEAALTIAAFIALGRSTGEPTNGLVRECRAITDRLGVVELPRFPLPAPELVAE